MLNIIKKIKKMLLKDIKIFLKKKTRKKKCGCESYKNLPENEKNTLVEYRKKKMSRNASL